MPRSNDNWEKLVNAVLRRKELRALAYCESMDSVSESFSSCTSFSASSSICYSDQSPVSLWSNELSVKKRYMLCARDLYISWKDSPMYWTWTSLPESRFSEVAELRNVCWLDIVGIMQSQILSPCTNYTAYLVYKLAKRHFGLDYPTMARIRFVENGLPEIEVHTSTVYIVPQRHVNDGQIPRTRSDGWMEIEIGTFLTGEIDNDIDIYMQLSEVEGYGWKKGLIIEGIEVRPNEEETSSFALLPEACTINILSLSSPKDACRFKAVSIGFESAADSNTLWERFLPPDYQNILARSSSPVTYSSKKELFFLLCDSPLLLDEGKLSFWLSKQYGKKCYMLCARELHFAWKDDSRYWKWISLQQSRFSEVAELLKVCWFNILGIIRSQMLSPKTYYTSYLVFKLSQGHYGFDCTSKATILCVKIGRINEIEGVTTSNVYIVQPNFQDLLRRDRGRRLANRRGYVAQRRSDGWMEIELGTFFSGENHDIHMQLSEVCDFGWKKGLIVQGIEVRPKEEVF